MNELRFFKDGFEVRTEKDGKVNAVNFRRRFGRWESDADNGHEVLKALETLTQAEKETIVMTTFNAIRCECIRGANIKTVRDLVIALMDCDPNANISVYRGCGDYTELRDVDMQIVSDDTGTSKEVILWADGDADEETEYWRVGEIPKEGQLCEVYTESKQTGEEPANDVWLARTDKEGVWIDTYNDNPVEQTRKGYYCKVLAWRPFTPPVMREKC